MDEKSRHPRERLVTIFASTILIVWVVSVLGSLYERDYATLTFTTPALLIAAGSVFGVRIYKNGSK